MTFHQFIPAKATLKPQQIFTPVRGGLLQRKCTCGKLGFTEGCEECSKRSSSAATNVMGIQRKLTVNLPGDEYEREADRMAESVVSGNPLQVGKTRLLPVLQRQSDNEKKNVGSVPIPDDVQKPREQPTKFPAQDEPKHGQEKDDDDKKKLGTGGLKVASEVAKSLWDLFSNSVEGKRILAANEHDWKPLIEFFEDFSKTLGGKFALGAAAAAGTAGLAAAAWSSREESGGTEKSPSTGGPIASSPKDEKFLGLELNWDFVTPPTGITLKTPWLDSPKIPLGAQPQTAAPLAPPPVLFNMFPSIPRICTPADPQGDRGEADARSAFTYLWLLHNRELAEKRFQEILEQSKLNAPQRFAPSAVQPMFKVEAGSDAIPNPEAVEAGLRSPSQPLDSSTREFMESRFGHDFGSVRVHTDAQAAESARAVNAEAFTVGDQIVFGIGRFSPHSFHGRKLIAHELTHTIQQSGNAKTQVQRLAANLDFKDLARRIYKAISGPGTDEEAVYRALQQLERDPTAIDMLKRTYMSEYKLDLRADIEDDFSGEELEYALQLINSGSVKSDQRIERGPNAVVSIATAIERLWAATDIIGTDEEAIFATLLPFNRHTAELEDAFQIRYGKDLRSTLDSELSGDEFNYAMELLAPKGERKKTEDMIAPQLIDRNFATTDQPAARKILQDILAVSGDRLDFSSEQELVDEIRKRLRVSQLMKESQIGTAFGYPESMTRDCAGYTPDRFQQAVAHARVNKDAQLMWSPKELNADFYYSFRLSEAGRANAYDAIVRLFTNQESICNRTLIHCDYLITVIQFRAFAESIGPEVFNGLVRSGKIDPILTYHGFPYPPADWRKAPHAWSVQEVRPASERDLVIGDHVLFWNHLAYDALTMSRPGPWRLENALLVDKDDSGQDLFEGHGAPELPNHTVGPGSRDLMLGDLRNVYNGIAQDAMQLTREVDAGIDPNKQNELREKFPQVTKDQSRGWIIRERDDWPSNRARRTRSYKLRELSSINDPELIGLRDPDDPSRMNKVKRPIESAKGPSPKP